MVKELQLLRAKILLRTGEVLAGLLLIVLGPMWRKATDRQDSSSTGRI